MYFVARALGPEQRPVLFKRYLEEGKELMEEGGYLYICRNSGDLVLLKTGKERIRPTAVLLQEVLCAIEEEMSNRKPVKKGKGYIVNTGV